MRKCAKVPCRHRARTDSALTPQRAASESGVNGLWFMDRIQAWTTPQARAGEPSGPRAERRFSDRDQNLAWAAAQSPRHYSVVDGITPSQYFGIGSGCATGKTKGFHTLNVKWVCSLGGARWPLGRKIQSSVENGQMSKVSPKKTRVPGETWGRRLLKFVGVNCTDNVRRAR